MSEIGDNNDTIPKIFQDPWVCLVHHNSGNRV